MIKSSMDFLDVLFPIKLGCLTYRCPEELSNLSQPGMIVSASLKNKSTKGIIVGRTSQPSTGEVKDIQKIHGDAPLLSSTMLHLLKWMSEYYIAEQGVVLKTMLPREAFTKVKPRKTKARETLAHPFQRAAIDGRTTSRIIDSIHKKGYATFLFHAPSAAHEYDLIVKILSETRHAIILIPEVSQIDGLYALLKDNFGERVCFFHSGLSRGKRSEAIERILSETSDIVLGTRSAIFAPLKNVSFIAVLHEHSSSYKQEDGLCFHGRDVAVMRGYLEKAAVVLSSITPSIESLYNCSAGKYTLLRTSIDVKKPRVKVIDMRHEELLKPYLSKSVIDASVNCIRKGKKVMFVVNRRGYSTLLQCSECNYIEACPECKIPLVLHKQDSSLKCHYCGHSSDVPKSCSRCQSFTIALLGAGTQRIQEDIEKLLGIKTMRVDSDTARKKSEREELLGASYRDDIGIIIGTKLMTRRLGPESSSGSPRFSMAALLNTDLFFNLPDFRSAEKAYQEISSMIEKVDPYGEILLQTRMPQNYLFKYLKQHNYISFFKEELSRRKPINYPPYARLILIKFLSEQDLTKELKTMVEGIHKQVEILGPFQSRNIRGKKEFRVLLKSSRRWELHVEAKIFIEKFKDSKDVNVKVDVDPITI